MAVTSYKFAGTIVSETISGGNSTDWTNPSNAGADDTSYAVWDVSTASNDQGPYLKCTNFGFTSSDIPSGATIDGIEVEYGRFEGGGTDNIVTSHCRAVKGGTIHTANVSTMNTAEWGTTSPEVITEGGASNLWGLTWLDTDITSSGFGIAIAPNGPGTTPAAKIDYVKVRVYYTASSGVSGTVSVTEEADSGVASGKVSVNGTSAVTEEADSAVASGKVSIVGTVAVTEAEDTAAASGNYRIPGTVSVTEQDDSTTASGRVSIVGTTAVTEDDDTSAANGGAFVGGTVSVAEDNDTGVASGKVSIVGTANIGEEDDNGQSSGSYTIFASSAVTDEEDSASASGEVVGGDISGTVDITDDNDEVIADGETGSVNAVAHYPHRDTYPRWIVLGEQAHYVRSAAEENRLTAEFDQQETHEQPKRSKRKKPKELPFSAIALESLPEIEAAKGLTLPIQAMDFMADTQAIMAQIQADLEEEEILLMLMAA